MKFSRSLLAVPFVALALGACTNGGSNDVNTTETLYNYSLSWENKNQKYEHFTDLGNYVIMLNDANAADVEKSLALCNDKDIFKQGCTGTAKRNSNGEVIFGRNMDVDVSQTPAFITCIKGGKHQALVFTYKGSNGYRYDQLAEMDKDADYLLSIPYTGTDAMNEAGLYIETNMREMDSNYNLYCSGTNPGKTRAQFLSLPALVATNCATVDEALEFINDSYDWFTPGFVLDGDSCIWNTAFLMGDATGNYGLVEIAKNHVYYTPYCQGQGNYYINPEIAQYAVNGSGYGRLAAALKGLPKCETEQEMMDNMKECMWKKELLNPGCLGYSDYLINVNDRRNTPEAEMQKGFEAKMAPSRPAAEAYFKGDEKALRDAGNVWTTSFNFGVNCAKRHLMLRLWERENVIVDIQWK